MFHASDASAQNHAPVAVDYIESPRLEVDQFTSFGVSDKFHDQDDDVLRYSISGDTSGLVSASISGSTVTVRAGSTTGTTSRILVTATDPDGLNASQDFYVTVYEPEPNRPPVAEGYINSRTMPINSRISLTVSSYFSDPDDDVLTYSAWVSVPNVVTVSLSGSSLTVASGSLPGNSGRIIVTARDPDGATATQDFHVTVDPPPVASVRVSPQSASIAEGETRRFTATALASDGTEISGLRFTWSSDDESVATVSSGLARGVSAGTAMITATTEGKSGSASLTVTPPQAASVRVSPSSASIEPGRTRQFTATARASDGTVISGVTFRWSSDDESVATVGSSGLATGVSAGTAAITATTQNVSDSASLTVNSRPVTVGYISSQNMKVGTTKRIDASGYFRDPDGDVLTYSLNGVVTGLVRATVDRNSGIVTLVAGNTPGNTGRIIVTASDGSLSADQDFDVTVDPPSVASVRVSPSSASIEPGRTRQFTATARASDGTVISGVTFRWSSDDESVATVGSSGLATGVSAGTAAITATTQNVSDSASLTVNSRPVTVGYISSQNMKVGTTKRIDASGYFRDPDGDVLTYSLNGVVTGLVRATVDRNSGIVTLVAGNTPGNTGRIIVTASDGSLSADQDFDVQVETMEVEPVRVEVLRLSNTLTALGQTVQLRARVYDGSGTELTDVDVAWSSSDRSVATVDAEGLVTAVGDGRAVITATAENDHGIASGTAMVEVWQEIRRVAVTPPTTNLSSIGETARLRAAVTDANGHPVSSATITGWSSSDRSVATVDADGLVTAVGDGRAVITATAENDHGIASGTAMVEVWQEIRRVAVTPPTTNLSSIGETARLRAAVTDANGHPVSSATITGWSSSDRSVATVDAEGLVTAVGDGRAVITATAENDHGIASGTAMVEVWQEIRRVAVTPPTTNLSSIGETARLRAAVTDANGHPVSSATITGWSSSDRSVATVDAEGLVTAVGDGRAVITAMAENDHGIASGTAMVEVWQEIRRVAVTPPTTNLSSIGETARLRAAVTDANGHPVSSATITGWSSSDRSVATVDAEGLVTAVGDGRAVITATAENDHGIVSGTAMVEVWQEIRRVAVTPPTTNLSSIGETADLSAWAEDANNHSVVNSTITGWSSSDESVATVNGNGRVTAVGDGRAVITATAENDHGIASGTAMVEVWQEIRRVAVTPPTTNLSSIGETADLSAWAEDANNHSVVNSTITGWSSSDESVATVNGNGRVTAVGDGRAVITATAENDHGIASGTAIVNVTTSPKVFLHFSQSRIPENGGLSTVRATVAPVSTAAFDVAISASADSPAISDDFIQAGNTLSFAANAGNSTGEVTIRAVDNMVFEDGKTITVSGRITTSGANVIGPEDIKLTIDEDDTASSAVALSVSPQNVGEGAGSTRIEVTGELNAAARPAATSVTVMVGGDDDAAREGEDFSAVGDLTLVIPAGSKRATAAFTLSPSDDRIHEGGEAVSVTGASAGLSVTNASVTITDNDGPPDPVLIVSPSSIDEAGGMSTVTVSTGEGSTYAQAQMISLFLGGTATVNEDYRIDSTRLTMPAGEGGDDSSVSTKVSGVDDSVYEGIVDETVEISGEIGNAHDKSSFGTTQTITIIDDDLPSLSISPASEHEGNAGTRTMVFTVTLNAASRETVTVRYATTDGTATAEVDYTAASDTVTFDPDDTSETIEVDVIGDFIDEGSSETFTVDLSGATRATIGDGSGTGTIIDDDDRAVMVFPPLLTVYESGEGNEGTVTLALKTEPTGSVTITPFSSDSGTAAVAGTATFTNTTWDVPQTITVTGVQEGSARIRFEARGGDYQDHGVAEVAVTVVGDPEVTIEPGASPATEGEPAAFTVSVRPPPRVDLTVNLSVMDPAGYLVSPGPVMLMIAAGTSGGTVSLATEDDRQDEEHGDVTMTVKPGAGYDVSSPSSASVTVEDNDPTPAVTLHLSPAVIGEDGGVSTVTASLSGSSAEATRVTVSSSPGSNAISSDFSQRGTALTIEAGSTSSTGEVTITAVDDGVDDLRDREITVSGSASNDLGITGPADATLTISPIPTLTLQLSPAVIGENGGVSTVTATLTSPSTSTTTVTVSSLPGANATSSDFSQRGTTLTIAAGTSVSADEVTITAIDNDRDEPDKIVTVSGVVSDPEGAAGPDIQTLTIEDDDARGVVLSSGSVVLEERGAGRNEAISVVLATMPSSSVTVVLKSLDNSVSWARPDTLVFTPSDWRVSQEVTVSAEDDDIDNAGGSRATSITVAVSGGDYEGLSTPSISVAVLDDDERGVRVSPASLSVDEAGGTAVYTVVLATQPTSSVTVSQSSDAPGVAWARPERVVFTSSDWWAPREITVWGEDDDIDNASDRVATLVHAVVGGDYEGLAVSDVMVTALDDDVAGVEISASSLVVDAAGGTGTYDVSLSSAPLDTVTVTPSSSDTRVATVSGALVFTPSDWRVPQVVTVTGVDDGASGSADRIATITHGMSGGGYGSVSAPSVEVTVADGAPSVVITPLSVTVAEAGGTATYEVSLSKQPVEAVSLSFSTDDETAVAASGSLTFTVLDWRTPQSVTVTGVDDDVDNAGGQRLATVSHTVCCGSYSGVAAPSVTVLVTDDDVRGVSVSASELELEHDGGSITYRVSLTSEPASEVALTPSSSDPSVATVSGALAFTPSNWRIPQDATLAGAGAGVATITHEATGGDYKAVLIPGVAVTVYDPDWGVLVSATEVVVAEARGTATYEVSLAAAPFADVVLTPSSSDISIATVTGALRFTPSDWDVSQVVQVTGVDDDIHNASDRVATLSHTVAGGGYDRVTTAPEMDVTVTDDDVSGVWVSVPELELEHGGGPAAYQVTLTSAPTADVVLTPSSTDVSVATVSGAMTFTSTNWSERQEVQVTGHASGTAAISHEATGGGYAGVTAPEVTVTVLPEGPPLSISNASARESRGPLRFTVRLEEASSETVRVDYATEDGTATAGEDYEASGGTLTFRPGELSLEVTVRLINDRASEADETLLVRLSSPVNASLASAAGIGTIDDDDRPRLSIRGGINYEGDAGTVDLSFTVSLNALSGEVVTVSYATEDGTAVAGEDYESTGGTLTFPPGESTRRIRVTVLGDTHYEEHDTLYVRLFDAEGANLDPVYGRAAGVIYNDDHRPFITISNTGVEEGDEGTAVARFEVRLLNGSGAPVRVDYATEDGTAVAGEDYESTGGTLIFAAGERLKTIEVPVTGDRASEYDERFAVVLSNAEGAVLRVRTAAAVIYDDDAPGVSISDAEVVEGNGGNRYLVFEVSLDMPVLFPSLAILDYATEDGTAVAGEDYTAASGELYFIPGYELTQTIRVEVDGDREGETDETLIVRLSVVEGAELIDAEGLGTITDDDLPRASVSAAEATEDAGSLTFTVRLSEASAAETVVSYATEDAAALAGEDYVALAGAVTIAPGATSAEIAVPVMDDLIDEEAETFLITLSGARGANLGVASAEGTIEDDDAAPELEFEASPSSIPETGGASTLTLSTGTGSTFETAQTITLSLFGTATGGVDYAIGASELILPAGSGTSPSVVTATVTAMDDAVYEGDETVVIAATLGGADISGGPRTVTIEDDDVSLLSISDASTSEGADGARVMTFTVRLEPASADTVTAHYGTSDGTAVAGQDYRAAAGGVTIAPGATSAEIAVPVMDDLIDESAETFTMTLSGATGANLGVASAEGTIEDDDAAPELALAVSRTTIAEAGGVSTLTLSTGTGSTFETAQTISLSLSGTATGGVDYALFDDDGNALPVPYELALPAGSGLEPSRVTATATAMDDAFYEGNETVVIAAMHGGVDISGGPRTLTIEDDDLLSVSITGASASEDASPLTFTVHLDAASVDAVAVDYTISDGTAVAGLDYEASEGAVTIAPGVTSTTIAVELSDDLIDESDETFTMTLTGATGAILGVFSAEGTIEDDDAAPELALDVSPTTIAEAGGVSTVTLSTGTGSTFETAQTVTLSLSGTATGGVDYALFDDGGNPLTVPYEFVLPAGSGLEPSRVTATATAMDDAFYEGDEMVVIAAMHGGADISGGLRTLTIEDDDLNPEDMGIALSVFPNEVAEYAGPTWVTVTARLEGEAVFPAEQTVRVGLDIQGSGHVGVTAPESIEVTIPAWHPEGSARFLLTPRSNLIPERDNEIGLTGTSSPVDVPVSGAFLHVIDDDLPSVEITADADEVAEGDAASFTVTVLPTATFEFQVHFRVEEDPGSDFLEGAPETSVTVPAGAASAMVILTTANDEAFESDAGVSVWLEEGEGYLVGDRRVASVLILDDDTPRVSIRALASGTGREGTGFGPPPLEMEPESTILFEVSLDRPSPFPVSVGYEVIDFTTTRDDYFEVYGSRIDFLPWMNATADTIVVIPSPDYMDEDDETFRIRLRDPSAEVAVDSLAYEAAGTIEDDDDAPVLSLAVSEDSIHESGGQSEVVVTVKGSTFAEDRTVVLSLGGSAIYEPDSNMEGDYNLFDGTDAAESGHYHLTVPTARAFPAGADSMTVTATVESVDDRDYEEGDDETVEITASLAGVVFGTGTIRIIDDDSPPYLRFKETRTSEADSENGGVWDLTLTTGDGSTYPGDRTILLSLDASTATVNRDYEVAGARVGTGGIEVLLPAGSGMDSSYVTFTLSGLDDIVDEADGEIVRLAAMLDGAAVGDTHVLALADDDSAPTGIALSVKPRVVSLDATGTNVTVAAAPEGGTLFATDQAVTVNFSISSSVALDAPEAVIVTIPAEAERGEETITMAPSEALPDHYYAEIGMTGTVSPATVPVHGAVLVANEEDEPVTVVAIAAVSDSISEGGAAEFTVTATPPPAATLTVPFSVSGDGYLPDSLPSSVVVSANAQGATFALATVDDNVVEESGTVRVTLMDGTGFAVDASAGYSTVAVADNDSAPAGIALSVDRTEISEGAPTPDNEVTVAATLDGETVFEADQTVRVTIAGSGVPNAVGFMSESTVDITIAAREASGRATFALTPEDNALDNLDEVVTLSGDFASPSRVPVTNALEIALVDDDVPSITIAVASETVREGAAAAFLVSADPVPAVDLTVPLQITAPSGIVAGAPPETATIYAASAVDTVRIETAGDDVYDMSSGTILVTLGPAPQGSPYEIGSVNAASVVVVDDDDLPDRIVLSVRPDRIAEGDTNEVTVTATVEGETVFGVEQTVTVTVSGSGEEGVVGFTEVAAFDVTIAAGTSSGSGSFTLATAGNGRRDSNETVAVTGSARPYGVAVDPATIALLDDDSRPVVQFRRPTITRYGEGMPIPVLVEASPAPARDLTINLRLVGPDRFLVDGQLPQSMTIPAGEEHGDLFIPTVDDTLSENRGLYFGAVARGTGYTRGRRQEMNVLIYDDDGGDALPAPRPTVVYRDGDAWLSWEEVTGATGYFWRRRARDEPVPDPWLWSEAVSDTAVSLADLSVGVSHTVQVRAMRTISTWEAEFSPIAELDVTPGGVAARAVASDPRDARPGELEVYSEILSYMGRGMLSSIRSTMEERFSRSGGDRRLSLAGRSVQDLSSGVTALIGLSGYRIPQNWREAAQPSQPGRVDALRSSSFSWSMQVGDPSAPGVRGLSLWGTGSVQAFRAAPEGGAHYDGDVRTGYLGADVTMRGVVAGVAVSRLTGTARYDAASGQGALNARMTGVYPYARWQSASRPLRAWTILGAGSGAMIAAAETRDLSMRMAMTGLRAQWTRVAGVDLSVVGHAGVMRLSSAGDASSSSAGDVDADVRQVRLGLEGKGKALRLGAASLAPFAQVAGRYDGGDGETGRGLEIAGGLRLAVGPLGIEARGRMLAIHSASGYEERGLSILASVRPPEGRGGLSMSIAPRWGADTRSVDMTWRGNAVGVGTPRNVAAPQAAALRASVGYDMTAPAMARLRLTPFGEIDLAAGDRRMLRLGARIGSLRAMTSMEIVGERRENPTGRPDHRVGLLARIRF